MSIGERIVAEVVKQGMVQLAYPQIPLGESAVFVWAENSYDQLTALVEDHYKVRKFRNIGEMLGHLDKCTLVDWTNTRVCACGGTMALKSVVHRGNQNACDPSPVPKEWLDPTDPSVSYLFGCSKCKRHIRVESENTGGLG